MTQDDIMRMAREAGFDTSKPGKVIVRHSNGSWVGVTDELERFAQLVRNDYSNKHAQLWLKRIDEAVKAEREHYDDLFASIKNWCEAYPVSVFPEPDFKKAHEVLKANGMTLDAISASNMKHVITQVQNMIDEAIRARGSNDTR